MSINSIEPPPGIGHNSQAPDPLQVIAWRRVIAKRPRVSPMIARIRKERATELGMSYADYAAVRAVSGRDLSAMVFSPRSLGLRLGRRLSLPDQTADQLANVRNCHLLCLCPPEEEPPAFAEELTEVSGAQFRVAAPLPEPGASWSALRDVIRSLLDPVHLSGSAALMIGDGRTERALCAAGRLADCLSAARYFPDRPAYSVAASRTP